MDLIYDENKRLKVLEERSLDLRDAAIVFEGFHLTGLDPREYGEDRYITIGDLRGRIVKVVWTVRGKSRRIITMWEAKSGEKDAYLRRRDIG